MDTLAVDAAVEAAASKMLLARLLADLGADGPAQAALDRHCHPDCVWEVFHPFNRLEGNTAGARFFDGLRAAIPDCEYRAGFVIGGAYEGRAMVSSLGHAIGTFDHPWLGIPPTHGLVFLRMGVHATVREGRIAKAYVLFDVLDLMLQAGVYPFRRSPGSDAQWPFPPCDTGATAFAADPVRGAESLRIVYEMQIGLPGPKAETRAELTARHSPHWHPNMNWFGPAGIGSTRGLRGFRNYHGALFLQAFPDRHGFPRAAGCAEDTPGHYIQLGDGNYAVTGGAPSLRGTHAGPEWLGLPPTGRVVDTRVADWYRVDAGGRIVDNWVMMDVPHMLDQMGLDIFHDVVFAADRGRERWPIGV